jgi:hypothetical protein
MRRTLANIRSRITAARDAEEARVTWLQIIARAKLTAGFDDDVTSHRANFAAAETTANGQRATGTVSSVAGNLAESLRNQSKK